jgi:hypothetical protein
MSRFIFLSGEQRLNESAKRDDEQRPIYVSLINKLSDSADILSLSVVRMRIKLHIGLKNKTVQEAFFNILIYK